MNERFPVLSLLSGILRVAGWVLVLLGMFFAVYMIYRQRSLGTIKLALDGLVVVVGLITVAFGELVGVFFAIEENTRRVSERISSSTP